MCKWAGRDDIGAMPNAHETRDDEYARKLDGRMNTFFEPVHSGLYQCLVATRHIAKGEEVLVAYGADYWQAQEEPFD